jgi:hypothetical protein
VTGGIGKETLMKHVIEAAVQVIAGTVLIFLSNLLLFPLIGIEATVQANAILVLVNTVVAFIKSYVVRFAFRRYE